MSLPLALTGQVSHSFDFSTHVFFASHYQRNWWSLWEPRWFEGFDVSSYPPLTHQLAALLGLLVGNESSVSALTCLAVVVYPVAVFELVRPYFGARTALTAASVAVVTPSVLLGGYAFGQLPTLFALDAGLFAAAALSQVVRQGGLARGALVVSLVGVVAAAHHATAIFFLAPLLGTVAIAELARARKARQVLTRLLPLVLSTSAAVLLVILPFWVWHATEYVSQVPIDHQSRHNLLQDPVAQLLFFWSEHGVLAAALLLALPALWRNARQVACWYALGAFLLVVSLGGTTPLPRLLFGSQWAWLTYDRFALWADVPLSILLAVAATRSLGLDAPGRRGPRVAWTLTLVALGGFGVVDALLPAIIQTEPAPIDPRPIVAFLNADDNSNWRYLTLGFGDQTGILNSEMSAGTLDGEYFTARRLPYLTQSGIAQLDFSRYSDPQATTLRAVLADPAPHSLRWVFTREPDYAALLATSGWQQQTMLANGIEVWEPRRLPPPVVPVPPRTDLLAVWWGTVPLLTLASLIPIGYWVRRPASAVVTA